VGADIEHAGADYVLFTSAHALQKLPAPHPVLDNLLPGRTCERDLIMEMADALAAKGKHLLVYYNHSCNGEQDAAWEQFTVVAKQGYAARLVTYNAGVNQTFLYTTHQDYWAGELVSLDTPAQGRYLDNGLQWFGWTCLEDRRWVHTRLDTPIQPPLYADEQVIGYVRTCNSHRAPMTFNVGIYQEGRMAEASVEQLHRLNRALRS
jgi:hypothetical protein